MIDSKSGKYRPVGRVGHAVGSREQAGQRVGDPRPLRITQVLQAVNRGSRGHEGERPVSQPSSRAEDEVGAIEACVGIRTGPDGLDEPLCGDLDPRPVKDVTVGCPGRQRASQANGGQPGIAVYVIRVTIDLR